MSRRFTFMSHFSTNITKVASQAAKSTPNRISERRDYHSLFFFFTIDSSGLIKPYIIATIAISTSVTTGDFICQYIESHRKKPNGEPITPPPSSSSFLTWWNSDRSRIMCTTAALVSTPWSFTLARIVERLFPGLLFKTNKLFHTDCITILKQVNKAFKLQRKC